MKGSCSRGDPYRRLVLALSVALPLAVFHETTRRPTTHLVAALPSARALDDPTVNATAMARAWQRWERGDLAPSDDRVFAPHPNAIGSGEYYPLPSLAVAPFARLGSLPLAVNVAYLLALATFPVALYAFYAELAGPGLAAALAALVVTWGPARMNSIGVLNALFAAYAVLAAVAAVRYLRGGRPRDLWLFGASVAVEALSSLYGAAMGFSWALLAVPVAARGDLLRPRRLAALLGIGVAALAPGLLYSVPYFRYGAETGFVPEPHRFEQHAADLLSVLHGGIFGGPVRDLLERAVPGFPLGAAAFFPTLTFLFVLLLHVALRRRLEPRPASPGPGPWVLLALVFFLFALGPTVRLAGKALFPGPYGLLTGVPVLSSLRGIHRWDQWFDVSLGAAAALALTRLRHHVPARRLASAFAVALALLDSWPARVPAFEFPAPSAYATGLGDLPRDASVALYPWTRDTSIQSWVDQLSHGRRVVNGWFSNVPPLSTFAEKRVPSFPAPAVLALYREMGASAVAVHLSAIPPERRAEFESYASPGGVARVRAVTRPPGWLLFFLDPVPPVLVRPSGLSGLRFAGNSAEVPGPQGRLAFRLGPGEVPVQVEAGAIRHRDRLSLPLVAPSPLRATLSSPYPAGATVRAVSGGRLLGTFVAAGGPPG